MYQPRPLEIEIGASFEPRMDSMVRIARQIELACDGIVFYERDDEGNLTSIEIADTFAFSEDLEKLIVLNVKSQMPEQRKDDEFLFARILEINRKTLEEKTLAQGAVNKDMLYGFVVNAQTISSKISIEELMAVLDSSPKKSEAFKAKQRLHAKAPNLLSVAAHIKPNYKDTRPETKGPCLELSL